MMESSSRHDPFVATNVPHGFHAHLNMGLTRNNDVEHFLSSFGSGIVRPLRQRFLELFSATQVGLQYPGGTPVSGDYRLLVSREMTFEELQAAVASFVPKIHQQATCNKSIATTCEACYDTVMPLLQQMLERGKVADAVRLFEESRSLTPDDGLLSVLSPAYYAVKALECGDIRYLMNAPAEMIRAAKELLRRWVPDWMRKQESVMHPSRKQWRHLK